MERFCSGEDRCKETRNFCDNSEGYADRIPNHDTLRRLLAIGRHLTELLLYTPVLRAKEQVPNAPLVPFVGHGEPDPMGTPSLLVQEVKFQIRKLSAGSSQFPRWTVRSKVKQYLQHFIC